MIGIKPPYYQVDHDHCWSCDVETIGRNDMIWYKDGFIHNNKECKSKWDEIGEKLWKDYHKAHENDGHYEPCPCCGRDD